MFTYYLKWKKYIENVNLKVIKTKNSRTMLLSKITVCGSKKSRFIKEQEANRLLSSLGFKVPLSKIPLLDDIILSHSIE